MSDLSVREWWLLAPIALAVFWMGIYPESFIRPMRADVGRLLVRMERVAPAGDSDLRAPKGMVWVVDPNSMKELNELRAHR